MKKCLAFFGQNHAHIKHLIEIMMLYLLTEITFGNYYNCTTSLGSGFAKILAPTVTIATMIKFAAALHVNTISHAVSNAAVLHEPILKATIPKTLSLVFTSIVCGWCSTLSNCTSWHCFRNAVCCKV